MDWGLEGKIALVTGAARGQGLRDAQRLADQGVQVVLTDVDRVSGETAAAALTGASFEHLDVSSEANWRTVAQQIATTHGHIDILVNNAAILFYGSIADTPVAELQRMLSINLEGAWLGIQAMRPLFAKSGGSIVNIASIAGLMAGPIRQPI